MPPIPYILEVSTDEITWHEVMRTFDKAYLWDTLRRIAMPEFTTYRTMQGPIEMERETGPWNKSISCLNGATREQEQVFKLIEKHIQQELMYDYDTPRNSTERAHNRKINARVSLYMHTRK
jgi:hypothetical protein